MVIHMGVGDETVCYLGQWKDETEFNWRYKTLDIRHPTCRECHKPFQKNWYENNKESHFDQVKDRKHEARKLAREYVFDYLSKHPCIECSEADPQILAFHHRYDKEIGVSVMVAGGYPIAAIQTEIEKCEVLCANCHRKKTMDGRGWFRGKR